MDGQGELRPRSQAEQLFADYIERWDAGESPTPEALCADHPDLAAELRVLFAAWERVRPALGRERRKPFLQRSRECTAT